MVQRKVPRKLSIQADHVQSDKSLANLTSCHQDGRGRGGDINKKMKKSRSIQLSDLEALPSSPSKRSLFQQEKQQPLIRTTYGSPQYMKPTTSSDAKRDLFPVILRNTESVSDCNLKASFVSGKEHAKTSLRSSSLKLMRTLTKDPSLKPSRACPRRSSRITFCADMNAKRATCSSSLKDSKLLEYLMLNSGGIESEGTSVMKVCPYTFCSLHGHRHDAPLPPLKSFLSERRRILKTQKTMNLEALSPQRLKVPCETKDSDIEQIVLNGNHASEDADMGFFIEIYAKVKEDEAKPTEAVHGDEIGKLDSAEELEEQADDIKQVTASMSENEYSKSQIDFEEDFNKCFGDVVTEADTMRSFLQERSADSVDAIYPSRCFHEDTSMGSFCSENSNDWEQLDSIEMDGSGSEAIGMKSEGQFSTFEHEEEAVSSVLTEKETESKVESLSESSPKAPVVLLDNILSSCYYEDILVEESVCPKAQPHGNILDLVGRDKRIETQEPGYMSNGMGFYQCSLIEQVFQDLTEAEENGGQNETSVNVEVNCATKVLAEAIGDGQGHMSLNDGTRMSQGGQIYDTSDEQCTLEHEEEVASSVLTKETESKVESLSESSLGEVLQEDNAEEIACFEAQSHGTALDLEGTNESIKTQEPGYISNGINCDQCPLIEEAFQDLTEAEDNGEQNETFVNVEVNFATKVLDEAIGDGQEHMSLKDGTIMSLGDQIRDTSKEQCTSEHEEEVVSSVLTEEEAESKVWSLSETSLEVLQGVNAEVKACFEAQPQDIVLNLESTDESIEIQEPGYQLSLIDEVFQDLSNAGKNGEKNEAKSSGKEHLSLEDCTSLSMGDRIYDASEGQCELNQIESETDEDNRIQEMKNAGTYQGHEMNELCKIDETNEDRNSGEMLEKNEGEANKFHGKSCIGSEEQKSSKNWRGEMRKFNRRGPKFLPLVPEPEPEKVELKHQMMDERKSAEEWMLDYALRQAVTKLAPVRKKKVELLVEAFETVMPPVPKWKTHMRNNSGFAHARTIQACS